MRRVRGVLGVAAIVIAAGCAGPPEVAVESRVEEPSSTRTERETYRTRRGEIYVGMHEDEALFLLGPNRCAIGTGRSYTAMSFDEPVWVQISNDTRQVEGVGRSTRTVSVLLPGLGTSFPLSLEFRDGPSADGE